MKMDDTRGGKSKKQLSFYILGTIAITGLLYGVWILVLNGIFYNIEAIGTTERIILAAAVFMVVSGQALKYGGLKHKSNCMQKARKISKYLSMLGIAVVISFAMETVVFNYDYAKIFNQKYYEASLDLKTAVLQKNSRLENESVIISAEGGKIRFENQYYNLKTITIVTEGEASGVFKGNVSLFDEARMYLPVVAADFLYNPGGEQNVIRSRAVSNGTLIHMEIEFDRCESDVRIKQIIVNEKVGIQFSSIRFVFMAALIFLFLFIRKTQCYKLDYDYKDKKQNLVLAAAGACCIGLAVFIFFVGLDRNYEELFGPYPNTGPFGYWNVYEQQMDAFLKGQLHFDFNTDEIKALGNPYDVTERNSKGVTALWDRVYYEGKWYSYFGIAPILFIYLPICLLFGAVPLTVFVTLLQSIFAILFVIPALRELTIAMKIKANFVLYVLANFALICGSFIFMMQSTFDQYNIAILGGTGTLAMFLFFAFRAAREKQKILKRGLLFFAAGAAFVCIVLSRPNIALLGAAFAAPLFLSILFEKERDWKAKSRDVLPFMLPVLIGAVGIMGYNYARFGSVFEFGTKYQITVSDISFNKFKIDLRGFLQTIYSYFILPLKIKPNFPFVEMVNESYRMYGNFLYQDICAGLLCMPVNLFAFFVLAKNRETNNLKKATLVVVVLSVAAVSYIEFLMAGIHIRYVCDAALSFCLTAVLLMLDTTAGTWKDGKQAAIMEQRTWLYHISVVCCILTICIGLLLVFSNERNYLVNGDVYIQLANLLRIGY